jgi:hypothetical protein
MKDAKASDDFAQKFATETDTLRERRARSEGPDIFSARRVASPGDAHIFHRL